MCFKGHRRTQKQLAMVFGLVSSGPGTGPGGLDRRYSVNAFIAVCTLFDGVSAVNIQTSPPAGQPVP